MVPSATRRSLTKPVLPDLLSNAISRVSKRAPLRKHDLVGGVVQKRYAAFHLLQDPTFALDPQRLRCYSVVLSHPAHQRFGLMDVQVVQHEMPLHHLGIAGIRRWRSANPSSSVRVGPLEGALTCQ